MDSYLLDSLIRDQIVDARDRAAKHELLRSIQRPRPARPRAWGAWLRAFVASEAPPVDRELRRLRDEFLVYMTVVVVAFLATGCGPSTTTELPSASGRRIQGASMVAGSVPVRLGAYEFLFADAPRAPWQTRRAALLVDLTGGEGPARGFVEAGRAGEAPLIYTAGGWAWQRETDGERLTVFELQITYLAGLDTPRVALHPGHFAPVRVVVHEGSNAVTLTSRR